MKKWLKISLIVVGIFALCIILDIVSIYTRNKPIFAIKNDTDQVYRGLLYDTYNCSEFPIPQIKAKWNKFSCNSFKVETNEDDGGWYNGTVNEIPGISMTIRDGTLTEKSATVVIKDTNGKGTYVYGTEFRIEKNENNNWVKPKETGNNCGFTMMAYYVNDDGFLEFEQNWECMYSSLEKGNYRLVKSTALSNDTPITEDEVKYFSVEFTIK